MRPDANARDSARGEPNTDQPLDQVTLSERAAGVLLADVGASGLVACRRHNDRELEVRVFFPGDSVLEDPGTGSLAGPLSVYAHLNWGFDRDVTVKQGDYIGRPCRIEVHADPNNVRVGGSVARFAEGFMFI